MLYKKSKSNEINGVTSPKNEDSSGRCNMAVQEAL